MYGMLGFCLEIIAKIIPNKAAFIHKAKVVKIRIVL
jgi:hypothetical protein